MMPAKPNTVYEDVESSLRQGDMTAADIAVAADRGVGRVYAACAVLAERGDIHVVGYIQNVPGSARAARIFRWGPGVNVLPKKVYRRKSEHSIYHRTLRLLETGPLSCDAVAEKLYRSEITTRGVLRMLLEAGHAEMSGRGRKAIYSFARPLQGEVGVV